VIPKFSSRRSSLSRRSVDDYAFLLFPMHTGKHKIWVKYSSSQVKKDLRSVAATGVKIIWSVGLLILVSLCVVNMSNLKEKVHGQTNQPVPGTQEDSHKNATT
jgi:hypothetical protein